MKSDKDGHDVTFGHSSFPVAFTLSIFYMPLLPLRYKKLTKIIDMKNKSTNLRIVGSFMMNPSSSKDLITEPAFSSIQFLSRVQIKYIKKAREN